MTRPTDLQVAGSLLVAFEENPSEPDGNGLDDIADRWRAEGRATRRFRAIDDSLEMLVYRARDASAATVAARECTDGPVGVRLVNYAAKAANVDERDDLVTEDRYVFSVRVYPLKEWVEPLRRWLHEEHFHRQLETPGIRWSRGYEPVDGGFHFLNLWGIDEPDIPERPSYQAVRNTAWYEEVLGAFQTADVYRQVLRPVEDPV